MNLIECWMLVERRKVVKHIFEMISRNSKHLKIVKKAGGSFVQTSQMKKVSKEHGVSFQPIPLPSRSHISRQCSCSPSSYLQIVTSLMNATVFAIDACVVLAAELNFGKEVEFHLGQISGMGAPTSRGAGPLKMGYRGPHSPNGAFPGKLNETKVPRSS